MRIAHISATFPPYRAGTGMVCYYDALYLARAGHEVTVITASHPPGTYHYPPEIIVKRLKPVFRVGNAPLLPDLLRLRDFDIIHLHYPFIFGAELVWWVSRIRGIPFVLTYHNDLIGTGLRRHIFDVYGWFSTRLILPAAKRLGIVTLDYARSCNLASQFETHWDHVIEIPNGVDIDHFHPAANGETIRQQYRIPAQARVALFVGALDQAHHFKGVDTLLHSFAQLEMSDAYLMIVGDGEMLETYQQQSRTLGIEGRTHFAGAISHETLPSYYAAADVVVLPSHPPESFGMVLIEAAACGKAVLANNIPGVRQVVQDEIDGLLADPECPNDLTNKLNSLLADPERCRRMGAAGRSKVEQRYAWPQIVKRLEQVYEEVLREQRDLST